MSHTTHEERQKVYADALATFGVNTQLVVALEELSEIQKEVCKALREIREMLVAGGDPILAYVLDGAIKCVEQQPDATGWTSTEKDYPKKPGEYLCRCTAALDDYPFYMVLKFYNDTEVPHFQFEVHKGIKVTDWMELPRKEPPW